MGLDLLDGKVFLLTCVRGLDSLGGRTAGVAVTVEGRTGGCWRDTGTSGVRFFTPNGGKSFAGGGRTLCVGAGFSHFLSGKAGW